MSREAAWALPSGRVIVRRGAEGWKIQQGVLGLDRAATPAQTLTVLSRAIRSRDYAGLLQLLPSPERTHWTAERLANVFNAPERYRSWSALAATLASPPTPFWPVVWLVPGKKARITIKHATTTTVIVLTRESDGWKVLDLRPRTLYTSRR